MKLIPRPKVHYAWVLIGLSALLYLGGGSITQAFGVVVLPLQDERGWSQGSITLAYAINSIVSALFSPAAGWVADKYGTRKALAIGALIFVFGMFVTGVVNQLWQFYLAFGLLLGIAQAIFLVPLVPGVMRWYKRQLGWGMGIMMASWGVGPAISIALISVLLHSGHVTLILGPLNTSG